jgi:tetrahydromethanopterin S-methyltransferase subunit G
MSANTGGDGSMSSESTTDQQISTAQFDAVMRRLDELETENQQLRDRVAELEDDIEFFETEFWNLEELLVGETGTTAADMVAKREGDVFEQLETLRTAASDGAGLEALDEETRNRMLPIHTMWTQVKDGEAGPLGDADTRAAHLFGQFVRRACGDPEPKVGVGNGGYEMTSAQAKDVIRGVGLMTKDGATVTAKRAMERVEDYSKRKDGGVPAVEMEKNGSQWRLWANKDRFNGLMSAVESAVDGAVGDDPDDTGNSVEDLDAEARNKLDEMEEATR